MLIRTKAQLRREKEAQLMKKRQESNSTEVKREKSVRDNSDLL